MVESLRNNPIPNGYNTGGVGGGGNVNGAQNTQETERSGLNDQLKTEKVNKKQNPQVTSKGPQLDPPAGGSNNTQEIADSIITKLGKLTTDDAGKGLFVLYQLLVLLQKAMNEMQKSMQVMRQAETNVVIANIEAEANEMESAAKFGLWMGVISGIVQIGASAFSMAGGIKGAMSANKGTKMDTQIKSAQQELNTLKAAPEPDAAAIKAKQAEIKSMQKAQGILMKAGEARAGRVQSIGQFIGSFAQFFKAIGDGMAGIKQADAKRIEGQMKQMEEDANKTNDLTKSVKDLLSAVLQLMQAVNRNEIDTNAQIFRGI